MNLIERITLTIFYGLLAALMIVCFFFVIFLARDAIAMAVFSARQERITQEAKVLMGIGDSVSIGVIDEQGTCGENTLASGCFYRDDDDNGYILIDPYLSGMKIQIMPQSLAVGQLGAFGAIPEAEQVFKEVLVHELCHYRLRDEETDEIIPEIVADSCMNYYITGIDATITKIKTNEKLNEKDVEIIFDVFYRRKANNEEILYWSGKTGQALYYSMVPQLERFGTDMIPLCL